MPSRDSILLGVGLGSAVAAGALAAYTYAKRDNLRAYGLKHLGNAVSGARLSAETIADQLPKDNTMPMDVKGSLSATGPGLMVGKDKWSRLYAKGDLGGVGVTMTFTRDEVAALLAAVGAKRYARSARKMLPERMYTGLEVSPLPISAGVVVDKNTLQDTKERLKLLEASIEKARRQAEADVRRGQGR